jgi:2-keto-4-pentenoate hydratase/2-oxohepta-3-ene-1,7-dioic acid hydratase in catechol pathway
MRLVTYLSDGSYRCGILAGDKVVDAVSAARAAGFDKAVAACCVSTRGVLTLAQEQRDDLAASAAAPVGRVAQVQLGPPLGDPEKILCLGLNYRDHAAESQLAPPGAPMIFAKFRNSLIGPNDAIVLPAVGEKFDYEAELAVVIGRRCKNVNSDEALDYVAGAMALNDVTARDVQHATSQWTAGKAIDTFAPCGPALVLIDEIPDLQDLSIRARVNGETVQDGHTSQMIFSVAETVAFLSGLMTLEVGDVIATGTPSGVGISRDPQLLLNPGDVVEVEIERIGRLRNPVHRPTETDHEYNALADANLTRS